MAAVALVDLRSINNVGNIARTAKAFGFESLYTVGTTPKLSRPEIKKTALGGETIKEKYFASWPELHAAIKQNYYFLALETGGQNLAIIEPLKIKQPILLVLGNERFGLDQEILRDCQSIATISHQTTTIKSLNVTNAFAIAAWWLSGQVLH